VLLQMIKNKTLLLLPMIALVACGKTEMYVYKDKNENKWYLKTTQDSDSVELMLGKTENQNKEFITERFAECTIEDEEHWECRSALGDFIRNANTVTQLTESKTVKFLKE